MGQFSYERYKEMMEKEKRREAKKVYKGKLSDNLEIVAEVSDVEICLHVIFEGNVFTANFNEFEIMSYLKVWNHRSEVMSVYYPELKERIMAEKDQVLMSLPKGPN